MSNLFDAQTKDVIESRMTQTLHTITEKEQSTMEGTFARDLMTPMLWNLRAAMPRWPCCATRPLPKRPGEIT